MTYVADRALKPITYWLTRKIEKQPTITVTGEMHDKKRPLAAGLKVSSLVAVWTGLFARRGGGGGGGGGGMSTYV